jgi:hypothetical protein
MTESSLSFSYQMLGLVLAHQRLTVEFDLAEVGMDDSFVLVGGDRDRPPR